MRTEGEIRQQLKQVRFRHLKRALRENFRRQSSKCAFNERTALPDGCASVHTCSYWKDTICDDRLDGGARARACERFKPLRTKEQVRKDFLEIADSPSRGVVASEYPDIAALMWVLDEFGLSETEGDPILETTTKEVVPVHDDGFLGTYSYRWYATRRFFKTLYGRVKTLLARRWGRSDG